MANSLSKQVGCEFPLRLTVFYNRFEDARLVLEGAVDGPKPPQMSFIHIPSNEILRRAKQFSIAQEMHTLSHTVFVDADLWFPAGFWREYAATLEEHKDGYWSCRVVNVSFQAAETLVGEWRHLSTERMDPHVSGERYGYANGSVGHFQCIPRELEAYQDDGISAVNRTDTLFASHAIERSADPRIDRRLGNLTAYHLDHPRCWTGTGGAEY